MTETVQTHLSNRHLTTLITVKQPCHVVYIVYCNYISNPMTQQRLTQYTPSLWFPTCFQVIACHSDLVNILNQCHFTVIEAST